MKKQTHSAHWFAKSKSWTVCAVRLCTAFLVWLLCSCIPIFYMLSTSFKSYNDLINPTVKWFPKDFRRKTIAWRRRRWTLYTVAW